MDFQHYLSRNGLQDLQVQCFKFSNVFNSVTVVILRVDEVQFLSTLRFESNIVDVMSLPYCLLDVQSDEKHH